MRKILLLFFLLLGIGQPSQRALANNSSILTISPQTESRPPLIPTAEPPSGNPIPELLSEKPVIITYIHMVDETRGWGIGNQGDSSDHILLTKDGGNTWEDRSPPEPAHPELQKFAQAYFANDLSVWVIYTLEGDPPPKDDPYIWFTRDGGQTWDVSHPLATDGFEAFFAPGNFTFIDEEHGWLLVHVDAGMSHDYSYLYATQNGGLTWERVADPYGGGIQSLHNTDMAFADPLFGIVSKDNLGVMAGAFFEQTLDGGHTWEDVFIPAPSDFDWFEDMSLCQTSSPVFTADQTLSLIVKCRLYGDDSLSFDEWSYTYIFLTTDRGETWQYELVPAPVYSLHFLDAQTGWAFGRDYFKTSDGGLSWVPVKSVNWDGQFSFVDESNGWAVARNEDEIALVTTNNGGETWQIIATVTE